jgi:hypothetical protein
MKQLLDRLAKLERAADEPGEPETVIYLPDNGRGPPGPGSYRLGPGLLVIYGAGDSSQEVTGPSGSARPRDPRG